MTTPGTGTPLDSPSADHAVEVAPRVWWVGSVLHGDPFQCHAYLIEAGDQSVLVDPGSTLTIESTMAKIVEVVPLDDHLDELAGREGQNRIKEKRHHPRLEDVADLNPTLAAVEHADEQKIGQPRADRVSHSRKEAAPNSHAKGTDIDADAAQSEVFERLRELDPPTAADADQIGGHASDHDLRHQRARCAGRNRHGGEEGQRERDAHPFPAKLNR